MVIPEQSSAHFVDKAVKACPTTLDDRQSAFFGTLDNLKKEMDYPNVISMGGFPAAHINIGWLQDRSYEAVQAFALDHGAHLVSIIIYQIIERCIQRLKKLDVEYNTESELIDVKFVTKDDHGYYSYTFSVSVDNTQKD